MNQTSPTVAIIGAGLGGSTAALATHEPALPDLQDKYAEIVGEEAMLELLARR